MYSTIHRSCKYCGEAIRLCDLDGEWVPFDDGGRHRCRGRSRGSRIGNTATPALAALPSYQVEHGDSACAGVSGSRRDEIENGSGIGCVVCVIVLIVIAIQWVNWVTTWVGQTWSGLFAW